MINTERLMSEIHRRFCNSVPILASRQFRIDTLTELQQVMGFSNDVWAEAAVQFGICKTKKEAKRLANEC